MRIPIDFAVSSSGCYEVTSHKPDRNGYPRGGRNYRVVYLHRMIYEECFGEIPDGKEVCHKCDNPKCINPEHLFIGTQADNINDMMAKGRNNPCRGEESGMAILTETKVREIRERYKAKDKMNGMRAMAREFGIGERTVMNIVERSRWGWLE